MFSNRFIPGRRKPGRSSRLRNWKHRKTHYESKARNQNSSHFYLYPFYFIRFVGNTYINLADKKLCLYSRSTPLTLPSKLADGL
jgi:hypothetical protein